VLRASQGVRWATKPRRVATPRRAATLEAALNVMEEMLVPIGTMEVLGAAVVWVTAVEMLKHALQALEAQVGPVATPLATQGGPVVALLVPVAQVGPVATLQAAQLSPVAALLVPEAQGGPVATPRAAQLSPVAALLVPEAQGGPVAVLQLPLVAQGDLVVAGRVDWRGHRWQAPPSH